MTTSTNYWRKLWLVMDTVHKIAYAATESNPVVHYPLKSPVAPGSKRPNHSISIALLSRTCDQTIKFQLDFPSELCPLLFVIEKCTLRIYLKASTSNSTELHSILSMI